MKINRIYFSLFIIILICLSCNNRETYYQFHELKGSNWSKLDTIYFDIDSSAIHLGTNYNLIIELVNNTEYPYQNVWLHIQDDLANSRFTKVEKEYELADVTGKWFGSGFGPLYTLSLNYKKNISFSEKRNYQIKIVQGMRDEPLTGIEKIGLKIEPSDTN